MLKRTYYCDICGEEIKDKSESFGLHFSDLTKFTLGNYGCTEGKHICYRCAGQLKEHLNSEGITQALAQKDL